MAFARTALTLGLLWAAYACFQFAWQLVSQANNYEGAVYWLWPSAAADPSIARIPSWNMTLVRGLCALPFLLLARRIGHKGACIVALGLMVASFPFLLTPEIRYAMLGVGEQAASRTAFALFLVFRLPLAAGATGIVVLQGPLIARCLTGPRAKALTSGGVDAPACTASLLCSLVFIDGVVRAASGTGGSLLGRDWREASAALIGIVALAFLAYLFVGMRFSVMRAPARQTHLGDADAGGCRRMLKDPRVVGLLVAGTLMLYAAIEPGSGIMGNYWRTIQGNASVLWDADVGAPTGSTAVNSAMLGWQILYFSGFILGPLAACRLLRAKAPLQRSAGALACAGAALWALSYGLVALGVSDPGATAGTLVAGFLGSLAVLGANGLVRSIPRRWGFSPRRSEDFAALSWTFTFTGYSALDALTLMAGTLGMAASPATVANAVDLDPALYAHLFAQGVPAADAPLYFAEIRNVLLGAD